MKYVVMTKRTIQLMDFLKNISFRFFLILVYFAIVDIAIVMNYKIFSNGILSIIFE